MIRRLINMCLFFWFWNRSFFTSNSKKILHAHLSFKMHAIPIGNPSSYSFVLSTQKKCFLWLIFFFRFENFLINLFCLLKIPDLYLKVNFVIFVQTFQFHSFLFHNQIHSVLFFISQRIFWQSIFFFPKKLCKCKIP